MTRRRFYAPSSAFAPDLATVTLGSEEARHLRDVLRLDAGAEAFVFDGEGNEYRCAVTESKQPETRARKTKGRSGDVTTLEVCERVAPPAPESPLQMTLAIALLKGEKFDLVVQKATELGVAQIVPVATKRADVRLRDHEAEERSTARWQRIALEASKQSGRARVPLIGELKSFASFIAEAKGLMFSERGGEALAEALKERGQESVTALVGPEGGWDDEELGQARDAGWTIVTFGGRVLRAETAAIVVTALLQHLMGISFEEVFAAFDEWASLGAK